MTRSMNRATNIGLAPALLALLTVGVSGCVTQAEFNQYKQEMDQRFAQQAAINDNLDDHVNAVDCELNRLQQLTVTQVTVPQP